MSSEGRYNRFEKALDIFRKVQSYRRIYPDQTQQQVSKALREKYKGSRGFSRTNIRKYWNPEDMPNVSDYQVKHLDVIKGDPSLSPIAMATVSDQDRRILKNIWQLYLQDFDLGKSWFECDLTFAKGDFYRIGIPYPKECFDQYPVLPEELPKDPDAPRAVYPLNDPNHPFSAEKILVDNSVSSIVIDLPQQISENGESNPEAFASMKDLALSYYNMLQLAYKKLKSPSIWHSGGILVVKVGDIDYKGTRIWLSNLITGLATGIETGLYDPLTEELEKEARIKGKNLYDLYPPFDFDLIDKFIHVYESGDIKSKLKGRSIKANDYFLVFSKGRKNEENPYYFLSEIECETKLSGSLLKEKEYYYVGNDLAKLKKASKDQEDIKVYKVFFKNKTLKNTISTRERVNSRIRDAFLNIDPNFPREMFDTGNKLLLYLENKIRPSFTTSEESLDEQENQRKKLEKTVTSLSSYTLQKLKNAGVEYIEIIYKKENKKIIILNDEGIELELMDNSGKDSSTTLISDEKREFLTSLFQIETYNAEELNCYAFRRGSDKIDGISLALGNMVNGFPFELDGVRFHNSESAFIVGMFSDASEEHDKLQNELIAEINGLKAKRYIRKPNEHLKRKDWEEFNVMWMLYVVWNKVKGNEKFRDLLMSLPEDAVIIEDSTMQNNQTATLWGARNKTLKFNLQRYNRELKSAGYGKTAIKALADVKRLEEWRHEGKFVGKNILGKILMLCRDAMKNNTVPPIDFELLRRKNIHLNGKKLTFEDYK